MLGAGFDCLSGSVPLAGCQQRSFRVFFKLALVPTELTPMHWCAFGRLAAAVPPSMLLASICPMVLALGLGSVLSLLRFLQRCVEARAPELERATQSQAFMRVLQACSSITGLSSLVLFLRLYSDYRRQHHG